MARWQAYGPLFGELQRRGAPLWNQLQNLQSEMNQLFQRLGSDGGREFGFSPAYPPVNIWEDQDALYLEAELPGVTQNDLEIYVTGGNQLTLKGQRQVNLPEKGVWHRQERGVGNFSRTLTLPFPVDNDKVEAHFENGVLRIQLAKQEAAKPRKIQVKGE